jgi:hypothetical protein
VPVPSDKILQVQANKYPFRMDEGAEQRRMWMWWFFRKKPEESIVARILRRGKSIVAVVLSVIITSILRGGIRIFAVSVISGLSLFARIGGVIIVWIDLKDQARGKNYDFWHYEGECWQADWWFYCESRQVLLEEEGRIPAY